MNIDLSLLPTPSIIEELDFEVILQRRIADFLSLIEPNSKELWRERLQYESEPVLKLLQENAYFEVLLRQRINNAVRATLLSSATGTDLDQVAANYNTQRLTSDGINETDDALRTRASQAFEKISTAGPVGAYIYHVLSADVDIKDCAVKAGGSGKVIISVLTHSGTLSEVLKNKIMTAVNDKSVRPLNDIPIINEAEKIPYTIEANLTLYPSVLEQKTMDAVNNAIQKFIIEKNNIGIDVTRSAIIAKLHQEGVQNVDLISPQTDISVDDFQVASNRGISIKIKDYRNE